MCILSRRSHIEPMIRSVQKNIENILMQLCEFFRAKNPAFRANPNRRMPAPDLEPNGHVGGNSC